MIKKPYLIQRGTIKRPLGDFRNARISHAVDMDYMGSSEFEFGAMAKSLRAMEATIDKANLTVTTEIKDMNDRGLRVFHFFDQDELTQYMGYLLQLRDDKIRLKENSAFAAGKVPSYMEKIDFWWDIENQVIWSFDKQFMDHIGDNIIASLNYMNSIKADRK
jgi:hemerythrin superfamily protein